MENEETTDDKVQAATDEMAAELTDMEQRSEEVGKEIHSTRAEWERKREDSSVPGAEPRDEEDAGGDVAGDWEGEGPAADDAGQ
jgi:hypothetical protein